MDAGSCGSKTEKTGSAGESLPLRPPRRLSPTPSRLITSRSTSTSPFNLSSPLEGREQIIALHLPLGLWVLQLFWTSPWGVSGSGVAGLEDEIWPLPQLVLPWWVKSRAPNNTVFSTLAKERNLWEKCPSSVKCSIKVAMRWAWDLLLTWWAWLKLENLPPSPFWFL